jgi:hypothetical protein
VAKEAVEAATKAKSDFLANSSNIILLQRHTSLSTFRTEHETCWR